MKKTMEEMKKDKMVTHRLSPLDIYAINYIYYNQFIDKMYFGKCTDIFNTVVYDLCGDIENAEDKRKFLYNLTKRREKTLKDRLFNNVTRVNIMGTELAYGKPYNVFMSSEVLSTIQNYLINYTEVQKPHSSWITQLALLNSFIKIAEKKGEYKFDIEDNLVGERLEEYEKIDLIEKFVSLFKNDEENADKIKKIKDILNES